MAQAPDARDLLAHQPREIVGNMDIVGFGIPVSGAWPHLREHRKAEGRSAGRRPLGFDGQNGRANRGRAFGATTEVTAE